MSVLIEAGPSILSTFPEDLRDAARRSLERLRIEVWENTRVTSVDEGGVAMGDRRLEAGTVIWAAGVAASPLARSLGVPLDPVGRVPIEPELHLAGHPELYVIGDLALLHGADGQPLPGVAPVAQQQARHAAANIVRHIAGQPMKPFVYHDPGMMATIGRAAAIAKLGRIHLSGLIGWLVWLFVHIMNLVGFRNRVMVLIQWAGAYISYQRSVRLITGREAGLVPVPPTK